MILLKDNQRYNEFKYPTETEFESEIFKSYQTIFGNDSILIDAKKKIGSQALGNTIPDGFLFDLSDSENPEFYLIEIELENHDFFTHIFPQITKFFAFFKNSKRQKELVEKLFSAINQDSSLKRQFKKYLGDQEIYKFLNDLIDSSQNILLIMDGEKPELPEVTDTYTDTWGKMVKVITIKKFIFNDESIFVVNPEFETLEYTYDETPSIVEAKHIKISEEFHLENVNKNVKEVYNALKKSVHELDTSYIFNPQKYYISIKGDRNIVFLKIRKKKIRMVVMMPVDEIRRIVKNHKINLLSESVQKFYNGQCAAVDVEGLKDFDEIKEMLQKLIVV